jgi:hypothetical protein
MKKVVMIIVVMSITVIYFSAIGMSEDTKNESSSSEQIQNSPSKKNITKFIPITGPNYFLLGIANTKIIWEFEQYFRSDYEVGVSDTPKKSIPGSNRDIPDTSDQIKELYFRPNSFGK